PRALSAGHPRYRHLPRRADRPRLAIGVDRIARKRYRLPGLECWSILLLTRRQHPIYPTTNVYRHLTGASLTPRRWHRKPYPHTRSLPCLRQYGLLSDLAWGWRAALSPRKCSVTPLPTASTLTASS